MGPKAKPAAKKKEGNPENGVDLDPETKAKMFMLTCQSLQVQLAERSEEASRSLAAKRELQARVEQISKDYEEEKSMTFEITQDMTRQYKGMQEELLARINKLEETVQDLNDKFAEAQAKNRNEVDQKDAIIRMKDDEIALLNKKLDDMAEEFTDMLSKTLEKMREKIEVNSGNFDAPDVPIQHRMEEMKAAAASEGKGDY